MVKANPTIQLIEDNATVRETIAAMLENQPYDLQSFASAEEFLSSTPANAACLILDYKLPGISGLELVTRLRSGRRTPPTVVVSGEVDVPETVEFFKQGAVTLLPKPFRVEELRAAIARAIEANQVMAKIHERFAEIGASVNQLTPREKTVLQAIVAGQLNKAIARSLDVSVRTVEGDRAKIVSKFKAETTGEVVGKYAQYSLISELGGPAAVSRLG